MVMYRCRKCKCEIAPTKNQIDKSDFICRDCFNTYWRKYRNERKVIGKPIIPVVMNNEYHINYRNQHRDRLRELQRNYQAIYSTRPDVKIKNNARYKLNRALKSGKITKTPCVVCGNIKSEGHHTDYNKPLNVVWLCRQHHRKIHAKAKGL